MSSEIEFRQPVTVGALVEALELYGKDWEVDISGMCGTREMDIEGLVEEPTRKRVRLVAD